MTEPIGNRQSSCSGKQRYADKPLADRICRHARNAHDTVALMAYRCRHCNGWHIGERLSGKRLDNQVKRAKFSKGIEE